METKNTQETTQPQIELFVTDEAKGYINETRKWAKFLAILGFIGSGLIAIMAVFAGSMFSAIWGSASFMISILYLLIFHLCRTRCRIRCNDDELNSGF